METAKPKKNPKYFCINCDFKTDNKKDYRKHTMTSKHSLLTLGDAFSDDKNPKYCCNNCNKKYLSRNGLWNHNKKCTTSLTKDTQEDYKELILAVIKDNQQLKEIMLEVVKNNNVTNNTNNISNCNNKSFNLQFFLNDTCKDAMNIMDFVNSVQLKLSDLEDVGDTGFVNGISNIIIQNLKTLDITQRPLHCSDAKREVLYVKDEDKWEKEPDNKPKVRKAIKHIACNNAKLLPTFQQVYPQSKDSDSKYNDKFNQLIIEAFGGSDNEDEENEDKIIRNLTKEVIIDKDKYIL